MQYGQDVFCNVEFFDEILKQRKTEPYKMVYQMLFRLSNIFLDIDLNTLRQRISSNQIYANLNNRDNKGLHAKLNWNTRIDFHNNTDQVYLINPGYIEDYEDIRTNDGALILSNCQKDFDFLSKLCKLRIISLIPKNERTGFETEVQESWSDVFKQQKMLPLNSLIITDNYLFNEHFEERKEESLFNLLTSLVPRKLDVDFHLTIFFYNADGVFDKNRALSLISEIKALHLMDDDTKLKVSIVSHTKSSLTHDRHLLTNYFLTQSGVGFGVIDKFGIQQIAKGDSKCVFHSISDMAGNTTIKNEYNVTREWLKKLYLREEGTGPTSYKVGDDFVNRLLDDNLNVITC